MSDKNHGLWSLVNTALLTIVLAVLSFLGITIYNTSVSVSAIQATFVATAQATAQKFDQHDRDLADVRGRMTTVEGRVTTVEISLAKVHIGNDR